MSKFFIAILLMALATIFFLQQRQIDKLRSDLTGLIQLLDNLHELIGQMMDRISEDNTDNQNTSSHGRE